MKAIAVMKRLATTQNSKLQPLDTILGLLQHQLYACGITEDLAIKITDALMLDPGSVVMAGRWNDKVEGYPKQLIVVAWVIAQKQAVDYLKEHYPLHFALTFLEGQGVPVLAALELESLPPTGL